MGIGQWHGIQNAMGRLKLSKIFIYVRSIQTSLSVMINDTDRLITEYAGDICNDPLHISLDMITCFFYKVTLVATCTAIYARV